MNRPVISLTTDFGLTDSYVAEMKGVILTICPDATIVDISHLITKFNIRMGSFILAEAVPRFPEGAVHVAVVDPDVGTDRKSILIETKSSFFVGPDNGLLYFAAQNQGIKCVREITNKKLMLPHVSNTFQGRDVFAPTAACLANGASPSDLGPRIRRLLRPTFAKVTCKKDKLQGEVLHVDGFGNIITNFTAKEISTIRNSEIINVTHRRNNMDIMLCKSYARTEKEMFLAIIESHGFLEIAINHGNAARTIEAQIGDPLEISAVRE